VKPHQDADVLAASTFSVNQYPEIDQAATIDRYRKLIHDSEAPFDIERIAIKSKSYGTNL
jgi:hypothetical protein